MINSIDELAELVMLEKKSKIPITDIDKSLLVVLKTSVIKTYSERNWMVSEGWIDLPQYQIQHRKCYIKYKMYDLIGEDNSNRQMDIALEYTYMGETI